MARIKKGDQVIVIAGKDKGKTGRVLEVLKGTDRVIVEGVQRVTKHTKVGQSQQGARTGGLQTVEAPPPPPGPLQPHAGITRAGLATHPTL